MKKGMRGFFGPPSFIPASGSRKGAKSFFGSPSAPAPVAAATEGEKDEDKQKKRGERAKRRGLFQTIATSSLGIFGSETTGTPTLGGTK